MQILQQGDKDPNAPVHLHPWDWGDDAIRRERGGRASPSEGDKGWSESGSQHSKRMVSV